MLGVVAWRKNNNTPTARKGRAMGKVKMNVGFGQTNNIFHRRINIPPVTILSCFNVHHCHACIIDFSIRNMPFNIKSSQRGTITYNLDEQSLKSGRCNAGIHIINIFVPNVSLMFEE